MLDAMSQSATIEGAHGEFGVNHVVFNEQNVSSARAWNRMRIVTQSIH
jgi:hypothetical protein